MTNAQRILLPQTTSRSRIIQFYHYIVIGVRHACQERLPLPAIIYYLLLFRTQGTSKKNTNTDTKKKQK